MHSLNKITLCRVLHSFMLPACLLWAASSKSTILPSPSCSVQDYFVRLANQKKGMLASTHLVLQTPEGTKYQAAKKWGLPAVTMYWILESARSGQRAGEERFLVDQPPSPGYFILDYRPHLVTYSVYSNCYLCYNYLISFFHRERWREFCWWIPETNHGSSSSFISRDPIAGCPER